MALPALSENHTDPQAYPPGIAYMDGQYFEVSKARVSILDYGFLHSDATYDVVHTWDGAFFRLDLHLERFFSNIDALQMTIPYSKDDVETVLHNCVGLSGLKDAYVEMVCTRGTSPSFSRDPRDAVNRFMAFAIPFGSIANPSQMQRGLHAVISPTTRIPASSVDPSVKNYHWLDMVQGLYHAYGAGGDTTILLDGDGNVTEGPGFNIFSVRDGWLTTPVRGVLQGITRRTVFDLCGEIDVPCSAGILTPADLEAADEVFVTSTAGGLMPITTINAKRVGDGTVGPIFSTLKEAYWKKHKAPEWTTKVREYA